KMNKPMRGISSTAMEMLRQYRWPGNVRELENAIERAVSLSFEGIITPKELPRNITKGQKEFSGESDVLIPVNGVKKVPLYQSEGINEDIKIEEGERSISYFNIVDDRPTLDTFTSRYLRLLLKEFKNNKTKVAQILGVERMTLYNMLERYNIEQKKENGKNKGSED
ncbi:MAG: helix-turn-helix domain-containing protein, partial [Myxococcota bacterium]